MYHHHHHHHHHQITKLSHSINAIGPAPHRSGRKREHRSIVFRLLFQPLVSMYQTVYRVLCWGELLATDIIYMLAS
jgi:hypothetical protein